MKPVLVIFAFIASVFIMIGFGECTYVRQGEKVFAYDVSSGKAVNEKENPLLAMGPTMTWGWNKKFFTVNGLIADYEFGEQGKGKSPYDETLQWNSSEGVVMSTSYKIYGHVTDPWEFFVHFGESEHDYNQVDANDDRVYEALRQAGKIVDLHLNEIASTIDAETIRTTPELLKAEMLKTAKEYMKHFGFEVTDLMFVGNFKYPDGDTIVEARKQITALDSEARSLEQDQHNKATQAKVDIGQAEMDASQKIGEAKRQASAILAESEASAKALEKSIAEIGIEATIRIKMAELQGKLSKEGVIPTVIVTEKSLFATPFYPQDKTMETDKHVGGSTVRVGTPSSSPASSSRQQAPPVPVVEKQ